MLPLRRPSDRSIVVVVGMHRSGTSLLSNVLHSLGVNMADETNHSSPANPSGFWERPSITALQEEVLTLIDRPIESPLHSLPFPPEWWRGSNVQSVKTQMLDCINEQLSG